MIKCRDLCFSYDKTSNIIKNINIEIEKSQYITVVGRNGSGKSTFAKLLNGLLIPTSGTVEFQGLKTSNQEDLFKIRQKVGMVFQYPDNQMVATIIEEDVAFGPENIGIETSQIRERVDRALKSVGMFEYRDKSPFHLSGGQKQRIAIAGILALTPDVIIFDESTSMLDPKGKRDILEVMKMLNENGFTIIHITHNLEEVLHSKYTIVFDRGQIIRFFKSEDILKDEEVLELLGFEMPLTIEIIKKLNKCGYNFKESLGINNLLEELCL